MINFPDFDKIRADAKRDGEAARLMADEGVKPEAGKHYTVSKDFQCGDRSWCDCIWHVKAISGPNLFVDIIRPSNWPAVYHTGIFNEIERAWYPADEIAAALTEQGGA